MKRKRTKQRNWTAADYNKAADAVMGAIKITPAEWDRVRAAIRKALKQSGKEAR